MDNTDVVDAVVEPLSDPNFKGVFAGIALAGALIAGGVALKKLVSRKRNRSTLEIVKSDTTE